MKLRGEWKDTEFGKDPFPGAAPPFKEGWNMGDKPKKKKEKSAAEEPAAEPTPAADPPPAEKKDPEPKKKRSFKDSMADFL